MDTFAPTVYTPDVVTTEILHTLLQGDETFFLIDVLPPEHYEKVHIAGAKQACVYEMDFMEQIEQITTDKRAPIIVYGAGEGSLDAVCAAGKLARIGYTDVSVYAGGLQEWEEEGHPLAGTAPKTDASEQPFIPDIEKDATWSIVPEESSLQWFGRNANSVHHGLIPVTGSFSVQDGNFEGAVTAHMDNLQNVDLAETDMKPVLEAHLASDDFFFTTLFPKAEFTITSVDISEELSPTIPNMYISGTLEIRGRTKDIEFPATVSHLPDGRIALEAHLDIDRTRWGIVYGSTRFFKHLSYHLVFDDITLFARFIATP